MGNKIETRVVILDKREDKGKDYDELKQQKECKLVFYDKFIDFIENENPKELSSVIVFDEESPPPNQMSSLFFSNNISKRDEEKRSSKILVDTISGFLQGRENNFSLIYPPMMVGGLDLKDELISYVKKYLLNIDIYLYVKDSKGIKILEHEKPYIKMMSHKILYILESLSHLEKKNPGEIKINRLFDGLYRKTMLKVVGDISYKDELKKHVSSENYEDVRTFEKSNISTAAEYVMCDSENLTSIIESKKLYDENYNIILIRKPDEKKLSQEEINKKEKSEKDKLEKENKMIWLDSSEKNKDEIIQQMKSCTEISPEQAPFLSKYSIIIGRGEIFEELCSNEDEFRKEILKKLNNNDETNKNENDKEIQNENKKKDKSSADKKINMEIIFLKEDQLETLKSHLVKNLYTFVVVFEQGEFLEKVKRYIKKENFDCRVQLTSLPPFSPEENNPHSSRNLKDISSELSEKSFKRKKLFEVKYKIKFEVSPLFSIYLYKTKSEIEKNKENNEQRKKMRNKDKRIEEQKSKKDPTEKQKKEEYETEKMFFENKIGLKMSIIEGLGELEDYQKKIKFIESEFIVCSVSGFQELQTNFFINEDEEYLKRIKVIIMDAKNEVKDFVKKKENYSPRIKFIDYSMARAEDFIKGCKISTVTIPFFKKGVLSEFEEVNRLFIIDGYSSKLSIKSSVVSSNELLKKFLKNSLNFTTFYNMNILTFRGIEKKLKEFEKNYIRSFSKLWEMDYNIINTTKETDNTKEAYFLPNFEDLKNDICFCFYKCKSYELLKINEEDFYSFYIKKIEECKTFFDLQIACIYILSLPHEFTRVISHLFVNPMKSKLGIKIFAAYILVIFTTFCQFGAQQVGSLELMALIEEPELNPKLLALKERDIVYSQDFVFCTDKNETDETPGKHTIVFEFENVNFLDEHRIRDFIHIEKFAFYQEAAEYLICPFTKFEVESVQKNASGYYDIRLVNVKNTSSSFVRSVFKQNEITEDNLRKVIQKDIDLLKSNNTSGYPDKVNEEVSLYRKTELVNMALIKQETITEYGSSNNYNEFFEAKNSKKYFQAYMHLSNKINEIEERSENATSSNEKDKMELNMLGIEKSYLFFKMSEYSTALRELGKVKEYLNETKIGESNKWKLKTIDKFYKSVETTLAHRQKMITNYPKRKLWKVEISSDRESFKLKPQTLKWKSAFDNEKESFKIHYEGNLEDEKLMNKVIDENDLIPGIPKNEFGVNSSTISNCVLFEKGDRKREKASEKNEPKPIIPTQPTINIKPEKQKKKEAPPIELQKNEEKKEEVLVINIAEGQLKPLENENNSKSFELKNGEDVSESKLSTKKHFHMKLTKKVG